MKLSDILLATIVAAIWGFNFVVIHVGIHSFPPLMFSALRFILAAFPLILGSSPAQCGIVRLAI